MLHIRRAYGRQSFDATIARTRKKINGRGWTSTTILARRELLAGDSDLHDRRKNRNILAILFCCSDSIAWRRFALHYSVTLLLIPVAPVAQTLWISLFFHDETL